MTTITIPLPEEHLRQLQEKAARMGVAPEELARATIEELLARPETDFEQVVDYVLDKNAELYKRLA
jgi:UDP-N-acetylglucosamine 2-epimerase